MITGRALRLGTRRSPMAMAQATRVSERLAAAGVRVEIVGVATSGDQWRGDLAALGGKAAFSREIDRRLLDGRIDAALHCLKDLPGDVPPPEGTGFAAYLAREDVHDVAVFPEGTGYRTLGDLPAGARVGTSAVRRAAQLARYRADLRIERVRGNVNARLERFGTRRRLDALILAGAGLRRIGRAGRIGAELPLDLMCPAVGAGVLVAQCRDDDTEVAAALRTLDDPATRTHAAAERAMLRDLRGHCNSPIAGHCAATGDGRLSLTGMVFSDDGSELVRVREHGAPERAAELGARAAAELLRAGARRVIDATGH